MNFIIFGVLAPVAYFLLRSFIKSMVVNFIQNAKRNSGVKNMSKCDKCEMFINEDEIKLIEGKKICNKPSCNK
tara:strand:- start:26 stop:244 length:219 start_codon:yes stop_codon:yes gene_type:complete